MSRRQWNVGLVHTFYIQTWHFSFWQLTVSDFLYFVSLLLVTYSKTRGEFDPDMRDRYGYLYYKYKTTHFYWEPIVIMPRKVFIALFRILTRPKEYHLLQASGIMIFLSGLTILQIKQQPFIEVFLNNMENVALTNHVFVLFFGVMFLSKALAPSEPGKPPSIMTENMYAFIMIGHMMATFAYLAHGVFKELWEMGLFQAGFNDLQNIILQQRGDSLKLIKRTIRSHWALRPLASIFSKKKKKRSLEHPMIRKVLEPKAYLNLDNTIILPPTQISSFSN